ncbi:gamma-glutamyltransferase [Pelomonas sp. SE-A7]|uniref:gamma-glutamyltransferase n=1 Tax=Pelomonas sp. SE-A7 TaxID=3054953 RepID=UPI00259D25AE|nr:gamma-glutamyltransferase [Pelomonas sp. SE-A7]MDM4765676.1 gamma-glutamyltransferase [Pelomonas sp. SE-A7]
MHPAFRRALILSLVLAFVGLARAQQQDPNLPEADTGLVPKPGWTYQREAVAAANPLAAQAGARILREGGNALDATIAVQLVLNLVEPQSSGIGGGAFLMLFDGKQVQAWDGRETAPAAARPDMLLRPDGRPMGVADGEGRVVATPGVLAMLQAAHARSGRLPWSKLMQPAIELAEQGFAVSPRLNKLLAQDRLLVKDEQARRYFFDDQGKPWPVGHRLKNPALAAVLRQVAERGAAVLQEGTVAEDIVRRVQARQGVLTTNDLKAYQPLQREAICASWREQYKVCGFPPPSSGQLTLVQTLKLLDYASAPRQPLQANGLPSAEWLHRYVEASKLAFADRALYIADPAFQPAPAGDWSSLLDEDYLKRRAALIGPQSMGQALAGTPREAVTALAPQADQPEYGTSHISVIDAEGRGVAMTTTIEAAFGARILSDGGTGLAGGFLLNNQMTDFSLRPTDSEGRPVANRIAPLKRPRSSMSPTLVFDAKSGQLLMSLGAPGGPAIISFTAKTLLATLAWGLTPQQAIDLPNVLSMNTGPLYLERERWPAELQQLLRERGHQVQQSELTSGLQAILRRGDKLLGGADPRREGIVSGR